MKTLSTAFKTHLAQQYQTVCTCWQATLKSGTVYRFTDHDTDVVISGWSSPDSVLHGTYAASTGFTAQAIATSDALNVDNTEAQGVLVSPAITEADLLAGLWDDATVIIFQVNWADITMGPLYQRVGFLGEVSTGRTMFRAEFRGLMQRYTASLCELTSVACRARVGDARCKVDMTPFTVTGTIDSVSADNATLYDAARVEAGPTGGVAVTGVTNANPGVVTLADDSLQLVHGQAVTISGVGGMTPINTVTIASNPSGATFELGVDTTNTTDYPAYTSGGTVTALGSDSGYFDFGTITFTSGLNNGISREVRAYVPGQITLYLPLPYLASAGDTYTLIAGCDNSFATCRDRFDNVLNFRGEPYIGGLDRMVQIGRST